MRRASGGPRRSARPRRPGRRGCTCGGDGNGNGASYGGNQVYLMVSVDNRIYGILFCHMKSTAVERYSTVMAGDVIGYVGSTGSSTGPHCHIEVFYLGDGDMEDLYDSKKYEELKLYNESDHGSYRVI